MIIINSDKSISLQEQIAAAQQRGIDRIYLKGTFKPKVSHCFSLITVSHSLELIGIDNAMLDGQMKTTHLLYIENGAKLHISGITFKHGNTKDKSAQNSMVGHPRKRLNIFRYLDGGVITLGEGSRVDVKNCMFQDNYSAVCGGAISNLGGYLTIDRCVFMNNQAGDTGSAIDNLGSGSLTVINHSTFSGNTANLLGNGTHGAITAFPDTYLIVLNSDFSQEKGVVIDYPESNRRDHLVTVKNCIFNMSRIPQTVVDPKGNLKAGIEIVSRYISLLMNKPLFVKLEGIPQVSAQVQTNHKKKFLSLS